MKIGIDISQIAYEGTGVANYTKNLVENLLEIDKKNEYVFFFSSLRKRIQNSILRLRSGQEFKIQNHNSKIKSLKFPPTLLDLIWNRFHILPVENLIGKIDVFHSSDWTQPPTSAKKITTIHDLTALKFPQTLHPKIVQTHKRRLYWVKKECDMIICVSKSTQNDVINLLKIPKEKTRVIYEGVSQEFTIYNPSTRQLAGSGQVFQFSKEEKEKKIKDVKAKYKIKDDYILSVGTQEPRKNLGRLIKAYDKLIPQFPKISLVIAGKYGWGNDNYQINKLSNCQLLGHVSQEDLPALYAGAKCFVYPSLYEGFGLPVLEAMTVGCPVVTSNTSSLPEVGGEAAIYCDPYNIESIKEAILKVLNLTARELDNVKNKCSLQSSKFSWSKAAKETLNLYEEILN